MNRGAIRYLLPYLGLAAILIAAVISLCTENTDPRQGAVSVSHVTKRCYGTTLRFRASERVIAVVDNAPECARG